MNKIIILLTLILSISFNTYSQTKYEKINNNTYITITKETKIKKSNYIPSGVYVIEPDGNKYEIYVSDNNKCVIYRTSKKDGHQYTKYIKDENACRDAINNVNKIRKINANR